MVLSHIYYWVKLNFAFPEYAPDLGGGIMFDPLFGFQGSISHEEYKRSLKRHDDHHQIHQNLQYMTKENLDENHFDNDANRVEFCETSIIQDRGSNTRGSLLLANINPMAVLPISWRFPKGESAPEYKPTPRPLKREPPSRRNIEDAHLTTKAKDYCANFMIAFQQCRTDHYPRFNKACKPIFKELSHCTYEDYIDRLKEFERERRLIERENRILEKDRKEGMDS
ncbi:unnamed protein product [Gordionus sp. m RMFG-2023]|uniref:uncharacterized protein LOC135928167 n=1 Tax=Gordionus sp. m RMFG-2023 TaxID=3053472 RepID=UPI0030E4CF27